MAHFYSDTEPKTSGPVDVWNMDGTKAYLRHYSNLLTLQFFSKNGTFNERVDAEKEILICERKLKFWEKHHNTDLEKVKEGMAALNKQWNQ